MEQRNRPKISITLEQETIQQLDQIAKRLGENRSRLLEQFVLEGVQQHQYCPAKGSGKDLPEIFEIYRRVHVYKDHYKIVSLGFRSTSYDVRWEDLPKELQGEFPPNISFPEWIDTQTMLEDDIAALEAEVAQKKQRIAQLAGSAPQQKPVKSKGGAK